MRILYRVKFKQVDVWPNYAGSKNDTVVADIYDHWIEAIAGETK
jgi:nitrile hydratase subunit beta